MMPDVPLGERIGKDSRFQKGNKAAAGSRRQCQTGSMRQVLISQLHEIDRDTGEEKIHLLIKALIALPIGEIKVPTGKRDKNGKPIYKKRHFRPNPAAFRLFWDYVEGRLRKTQAAQMQKIPRFDKLSG